MDGQGLEEPQSIFGLNWEILIRALFILVKSSERLRRTLKSKEQLEHITQQWFK